MESYLARLIDRTFTARVGTGASRGQGWVEVSQGNRTPESWGPADKRFKEFQAREREQRPVLAVTFLTDGLFSDNYLRDTTAPTVVDLATLDISSDDWESQYLNAFMDTRMVFGFDGEPVRLPRQPRLAVAAGSVFIFIAKQGRSNPAIPDGDGTGWIGDRNREGYGQVVLWHPFHLDPEGGAP